MVSAEKMGKYLTSMWAILQALLAWGETHQGVI